jgi:hypothetical protein
MVARVSPDMLVAASVFASSAILLTLRKNQSPRIFIFFGAALALGYWIKAVLFPLGFIFLLAAAVEPALRPVRRRLAVALAVFLGLSAPLVAVQSVNHGSLTYSRSASLNYAWFVNGVQRWIHWQGGPIGHGAPLHRSQQIHAQPNAFMWQEPAGSPAVVSYHPWYDPTYWHKGAEAHFNLRQQFSLLRKNTRLLGKIIVHNLFSCCH